MFETETSCTESEPQSKREVDFPVFKIPGENLSTDFKILQDLIILLSQLGYEMI